MKKLLLNNWHAKLISLILATTLWYLIKKNVATTPLPSEVIPAAGDERRTVCRLAAVQLAFWQMRIAAGSRSCY